MGKKKLVADGYGRYPVLLGPKGLGGWATRFHNMLNSHKVDDKGRNEICLKFEATSKQLTNCGGFSNRDITSSVFLNVGGSCLLEILSVFWSTASFIHQLFRVSRGEVVLYVLSIELLQKDYDIPSNTDWFTGILIMPYYHPI